MRRGAARLLRALASSGGHAASLSAAQGACIAARCVETPAAIAAGRPLAALGHWRGFAADGAGSSGGGSSRPPADAVEGQQAQAPAEQLATSRDAEDALAGGDDLEEEDVDALLAQTFEQLIGAAMELVQQGKPAEAEYVLEEGAKQAAEILGDDAPELAALYDQLALIRFLHERIDEAADAAKKVIDILKAHEEAGAGPALAIAGIRYAAALLAGGNPQEAQLYLGRSVHDLEAALRVLAEMEVEDEEEAAALADTREKFEIGLGEARYYLALAKQAQNLEPAAVGEFLGEMRRGLEVMQESLGAGNALIAGALREHTRMVMAAMDREQLELAEALYIQEARLHTALGGDFEHIALTLYQCGTLQYCMGRYDRAAESLRMALQTVSTHIQDEGDARAHALTVQQRLGSVLALQGRFDQAREMLHEVAPALEAAMGPDNPATEEVEFTLALISLKEMEADGVTDAARKQELLAAMQGRLERLGKYGEDHMLVKKAREVFAAAASGGTGTGSS